MLPTQTTVYRLLAVATLVVACGPLAPSPAIASCGDDIVIHRGDLADGNRRVQAGHHDAQARVVPQQVE